MGSKGNYRSPLARVRGLGAAKSGVEHWWLQRASAIALLPLVVVFTAFAISLTGASHAEVAAFLGRPLPAGITILLVIAAFWHLKLGGQVIIEDYVSHEGVKLACVLALTFATVAVGLACILAVLRLVVAGA
ncbi:MAG: succinate dehydrogenase, hydrophobic membrane anchor protein [Alphaproteobacteria bacterium]|nr:succinate dehydrogenase, hydrophobic membrane anchor protein [Alphaproteobacteria bacterium]